MAFYDEPIKNTSQAYNTDGTHKWFGKAASGCRTADKGWTIFKMEYDGSNWIIKYPKDPDTGLGSDAPKFIWDNVASYEYLLLGVKDESSASSSSSSTSSHSSSSHSS